VQLKRHPVKRKEELDGVDLAVSPDGQFLVHFGHGAAACK
jgi:hypothetical protein